MTRFIDEHRDIFGVEPICRTLAIAPSTHYAAKTRPPSARAIEDERLKIKIERVHHGACGDIPPAEYEAAYWADQQVAPAA